MKAITSEIEDGIVRICEGNPGALTVLCRMVKAAPNAITAELMLHALELAGITGSRLWQEYKDVHQFELTRW